MTDLHNPEQQAIVAAPLEGSHLVLAGPGSGKTRVIVHRVAWLLRESMVLPDDIMVLTYNRSAAIEIKRRLWALVGKDAAGVTVQTLHSLAMRLTGTSYAVSIERDEKIDFSTVIKTATAHLQKTSADEDSELAVQRDRLLSGLRYLLVDEYQDIDADHYALISAVAGRSLHNAEDKLSLLAVGDDDQNIYAFRGANVKFIKQFSEDYQAKTYYLVENYRSTQHIIHCANQVIAPAQARMKDQQAIRINHARKDAPEGGEFATLDSLTQGRVHILETPAALCDEVTVAFAELLRLSQLQNPEQPSHWGRFAVIARQWAMLEPMAALCRLYNIPVRLLQDNYLQDLHKTREGHSLLSLLNNPHRKAKKPRMLLRSGLLSRWFRKRFRLAVDDLIESPYRAMLAQFIIECEASAPGNELLVCNIIEALYEFGSGNESPANDNRHAPMQLLTAHRAKGLEFDHVLILDAGGWQKRHDEERRLFYMAMTRARKTLTVCARQSGGHGFVRDFSELCVKSQPTVAEQAQDLKHRTWVAEQKYIDLSWPMTFAPDHLLHQAIADLDYGSELSLQKRSDGKPGWELANPNGATVTRMAQAFNPPSGKVITVRVAAILVRKPTSKELRQVKCPQWEVVLPRKWCIYRPIECKNQLRVAIEVTSGCTGPV